MTRWSIVIALAACGAKKVDHVELEIAVFSKIPATGAHLELDGRDVGALGSDHTMLTVPPVERRLDGFALVAPTPCGPRRIPLAFEAGGHKEIDSTDLAEGVGGQAYVALRVPDDALTGYGVLYDNRGGGAKTLTIGTLEQRVPTGSSGVLPVWNPTCATPVTIAVDGRPLDVVQTAFADQCGASPPAVFVGLAARCYVVHAIPYEFKLSPHLPGAAPATETNLEGHDAYVVPDIRFVMTKAPPSVRDEHGTLATCLRDILECNAP